MVQTTPEIRNRTVAEPDSTEFQQELYTFMEDPFAYRSKDAENLKDEEQI